MCFLFIITGVEHAVESPNIQGNKYDHIKDAIELGNVQLKTRESKTERTTFDVKDNYHANILPRKTLLFNTNDRGAKENMKKDNTKQRHLMLIVKENIRKKSNDRTKREVNESMYVKRKQNMVDKSMKQKHKADHDSVKQKHMMVHGLDEAKQNINIGNIKDKNRVVSQHFQDPNGEGGGELRQDMSFNKFSRKWKRNPFTRKINFQMNTNNHAHHRNAVQNAQQKPQDKVANNLFENQIKDIQNVGTDNIIDNVVEDRDHNIMDKVNPEHMRIYQDQQKVISRDQWHRVNQNRKQGRWNMQKKITTQDGVDRKAGHFDYVQELIQRLKEITNGSSNKRANLRDFQSFMNNSSMKRYNQGNKYKNGLTMNTRNIYNPRKKFKSNLFMNKMNREHYAAKPRTRKKGRWNIYVNPNITVPKRPTETFRQHIKWNQNDRFEMGGGHVASPVAKQGSLWPKPQLHQTFNKTFILDRNTIKIVVSFHNCDILIFNLNRTWTHMFGSDAGLQTALEGDQVNTNTTSPYIHLIVITIFTPCATYPNLQSNEKCKSDFNFEINILTYTLQLLIM